jgi:hypothetical protein
MEPESPLVIKRLVSVITQLDLAQKELRAIGWIHEKPALRTEAMLLDGISARLEKLAAELRRQNEMLD